MTPELKNRLDAIVGKTFNYNGKKIIIDKYKIVNAGTNIIVFTPQPINFLPSEIDNFLNNLSEVSKIQNIPTKTIFSSEVNMNKILDFEPSPENRIIKDTLLETLRKVKDDATYIPQAKTVCEVVNSLIDVQKNEIQMLSVINKYKR
jgi:hypothetical protein